MLGKQIEHASKRRRFTRLEKFIEDQHAAAGSQYARRLPQAGASVGDNREDQMQHDMIKTLVRERQRHAIALDKVHVKISYAGLCLFQHGHGEIEAGITMSGRKMWEIEAGADTTDQDVLSTLLWQLGE